MLAQMAERDPVTGALQIKTSTGSPMQNPLLPIAVSSASDMIRYAAEFGLTPAARSRVAGGIVGRAMSGKFGGLLGWDALHMLV